MKSETNNEIAEIVTGDEADVKRVRGEYLDAVNEFSTYQELQERNWDTRHCEWPGQTEDQRKHARGWGANMVQPFPWNGASDLRVPVVDEVVGWCVAMDVTALAKANLRAMPVGMDDLKAAAIVSNFMRWLVLSQIEEYAEQAELLSQYRHERGLGVLKVYWASGEQKVLRTLRLEELAQMSPDVAQSIQGGQLDPQLAELMVSVFGQGKVTISKKKARTMVRELREKGETTIPQVVGVMSRPCIKALAPGEDIFFPTNTRDLQTASAIYERVYFTPATLRSVAAAEGWDEEYADYVAEHCVSKGGQDDLANVEYRYKTDRMSGSETGVRDGLVEIVYAYQRRSDEDGVLGLYQTVFCPQAGGEYGEMAAKHGILPITSGKYPYVPFKREVLSPCLLDSRGVPETTKGWQEAIKVEVDGRIDAASMATLPPRFHPPGREATVWGPGQSVPQRRPGEYGYLPVPPFPNASVEVQAALTKLVRSFHGRPTDALDGPEASVKQQKVVNDYLRPWQTAFRMIWELYQQYGPDEEFFRVIGAPQEKAQQFTKGQYSGKYDFYLSFDVLTNDPEQFMPKLEKIAAIAAQHDRGGQINWGEMLVTLIGAIDPLMAERIILPAETASNKEIADTQGDIAKMVAGVELDAPQNANSDLRMQVLQQWQQGPQDNPAQDVQAMLQQNQPLQKRLERYTQQLQFQKQQQQNAVIGRVGTTPAQN